MNVSPCWVDVLVAAGFEAVHRSEVGARNATDRTIMAYAAEHGCVVPTVDTARSRLRLLPFQPGR